MLKLKEKFVGLKRKAAVFMAVTAVATMTALPALAEEPVTGGTAMDSVIVTEEMLTPIVDAVTSNVRVVLPVGITIFGILFGIFLIVKIFRRSSGNG